MAEGDLFQAAEDLLAACTWLLGEDAPESRFVRNGIIIMDEEDQLAVYIPSFGGWVLGGFTDRQQPVVQPIAGPTQINLTVAITRCAEAATPTPATQQAVAEKCYADAWILWNGLRRLVERHEIFTVPVEAGPDALVAPSAVINESGNVTGWTLGVVCTLEGYDPTDGDPYPPPPSPPPPAPPPPPPPPPP